MKFLMAMLFAVTSFSAVAQSVGANDVEPMLKQMEESGQIDAKQAELTRQYMKSMDQKKWAEIQKKAEDCIKRNPAAAEKAKDGEPLPLDACN
jgi:hypothetical protein